MQKGERDVTPLIDVNDTAFCERVTILMDSVYARELRVINGTNPADSLSFSDNLQTVTVLLGQCSKEHLSGMTTQQWKAAFRAIQYGTLAQQEKYYPLLEKYATAGFLSQSAVAMYKDRLDMMLGRPQEYGTQIIRDSVSGKLMLYPLEDSSAVDAKRAAKGFDPLATYLEKFGIAYPEETTGRDTLPTGDVLHVED